jgi:hypothetical protein
MFSGVGTTDRRPSKYIQRRSPAEVYAVSEKTPPARLRAGNHAQGHAPIAANLLDSKNNYLRTDYQMIASKYFPFGMSFCVESLEYCFVIVYKIQRNSWGRLAE